MTAARRYEDANIPKISRGLMKKTHILLRMEYSPRELAEILGVTRKTIYVSYLPAGLPYRRDESGYLWIVGTDFTTWAENVSETSSRRPKEPLKPDEAYCVSCCKRVTMLNPKPGVEPRNKVVNLMGQCPICGNQINRFFRISEDGTPIPAKPTPAPRYKKVFSNPDPRRGLISRKNYQDIQDHLKYRADILQNVYQTIRGYRLSYNYLLEWAGSTSFTEAQSVEPTFPKYLLTARKDGKDGILSLRHLEKITNHARVFFEWAKRKWPSRYKKIEPDWMDALRPPKEIKKLARVKKREYWTLEEVEKIRSLEIPRDNLRLWRTQAAIVFLFLSGMRSSAFLTLPVSCVDIKARRVEQEPAKGVQTKGNKAAITTLLNIPELIDYVAEWDSFVRKRAPHGTWYVVLDTEGNVDHRSTKNPLSMRTTLGDTMAELCEMAGVEYKSPHKLRHGHGVYGVQNAKDIEQLQAVSQNMMHANLSITTGIYGRLTHEAVNDAIRNLGKGDQAAEKKENTGDVQAVMNALRVLSENPDLVAKLLTGLD